MENVLIVRSSVDHGLDLVGAELERVVHRTDGGVDVGVAADHGDADLRGADQFQVDPGVGQGAEELADTPGWERMPAPTSDTLPMCWSKLTSENPTVFFTFSSAAIAAGPSLTGSVKEMSASLLAPADRSARSCRC